jgi:methionyl-tRNA synthetase
MNNLPDDTRPDAPAGEQGPEPKPGPEAMGGTAPKPAPEPQSGGEPELLSIDEFARIQLRVARVVEVEPHPNADRLLKLQVDLGDERRQLVAGIAAQYKPEDLVGKHVVIVANLKPAKLRGEISQGMILAASDGDIVSVLMPDKPVSPGSKIR